MKVAVVMGSISDKEVAEKAIRILQEFNIEVEKKGYISP